MKAETNQLLKNLSYKRNSSFVTNFHTQFYNQSYEILKDKIIPLYPI